MTIFKKILLAVLLVAPSLFFGQYLISLISALFRVNGFIAYLLSFLIIESLLLWLVLSLLKKDNNESQLVDNTKIISKEKKVDYTGMVLIIIGLLLFAWLVFMLYALTHIEA